MARLFGSAALAAVLAIGFAGAPAGAEAGPGLAAHGQVSIAPGAAAAAGNSRPRPVTLINGDQLLAGAERGGGMSHELIAGTARGVGAALATMTLGGRTYVVPADALPYLGRGLDPGLFDIARLLRDQAGGRLPVEVRYAGRVPSLPGISITVAHRGIARGYLTAASAKRFGAALARQFTADHARGSYGQDGLFAGRVSISLPGAAGQRAALPGAGARSARRAASPRTAGRHFPMETLTVTGTNLAGKPDTGDEVAVFNADNSSRFADPVESGNFFDKGVTKFSVPSGHYWAVGMFSQFAGKSYVGERIVVLPQFTVRGSTTVSVAGRAASSRIHMVIPRPSQVDYTLFTLLRSGASGPVAPFGWEGLYAQRIWVSPTSRKPTVGAFQAITASQLDSPAGAAGTPYEYGLAYRDTSGLIPSQRHVVHTATLAHVHARYYQAMPARVQQFMTVGTSQTDRLLGFAGLGVIFHAPSRINEYLSAGHSLIWSDQYFQQDDYLYEGGGQIDPGKTFTPGERVIENWGGFPLHVASDVNLTGAREPAAAAGIGVAYRQLPGGLRHAVQRQHPRRHRLGVYAHPARHVLRAIRDRRERDQDRRWQHRTAQAFVRDRVRHSAAGDPEAIDDPAPAHRGAQGERVPPFLGEPHRVDVAVQARGRQHGAARLAMCQRVPRQTEQPVLCGRAHDDAAVRHCRADLARRHPARPGRCCR